MRSSVTPQHIASVLAGLSPKEKDPEYAYARQEKVPSVPRPVGEFLRTMAAATRPSHILDIGCGIGTSTRYLAEGAPNASVIGIDRNSDRIDKAVDFCKDCTNVTFQSVQASAFLRQTRLFFDLVFVDGVKRDYGAILHFLKPRLAEHAVIIFDDVLLYGLVGLEDCEISDYHRPTVLSLREFLADVRQTHPTTSSILPVGDGVLVIAP